MYLLRQRSVKGTMLKSECCLSYRMRVMKAGVKSRLDHTPKSECLTSSHVEYLMREQAGDGKAATERHLNWKHKTQYVLENSAASTEVITN